MIWDKRVFEKLDVIVGLFSVSVLLRGVVDDFVGLVQVCMVLMTMVSGILYGRSYPKCVLAGLWLGVL